MVLLLAFLDLLKIEGEKEVDSAIQAFKQLLRQIDPLSSFNLLKLKLKALTRMRDDVLMKGSGSAEAADGVSTVVRDLLERALALLESAGDSSATFSDTLAAAIEDLKKAKDMVSLEKLSKHLIDASADMMDAANEFQSNLGEIAHVMMEYERSIHEMEGQIEKHKQEALRDQLTGIYNRGAFNQRFKNEVAHALRFRSPLCLMLLDLDNFKGVNDRYGHQVGDDVLVNFAKLMSKFSGKRDLVFRFGGDEFAILFPNLNYEDVKSFGERLQRYVRENAYRFEDVKFNMGVSGGAAFLQKGEDLDGFFKRADKQLYQAKEGRGRICIEK